MADNTFTKGVNKDKIQFVLITNPFNLVKDPDLMGLSEVYETHTEKLTDALQMSFLVKETKKSVPLRVHTVNVKRPSETDFRNMMNIYYRYRMFPLVECGKSSMRKDVFVVDIDDAIGESEFFAKIRMIEGLPECIITKHISTKHWQLQFYLKNPIYTKCIDFSEKTSSGKVKPTIKSNDDNKALYMTTTKRLAQFFRKMFSGTDFYYQGTLCRNPWCETQKSWVVDKHVINSIHNQRPIGENLSTIISFLDNKNIVLRKNINLDSEELSEKNPELSRHKLTMIYAREWIWKNMREGYIPSEDKLEDYLLNHKVEIADKCLKEPHSDHEIKSQVRSLYKWSVENYKEVNKKNNQWKSSYYWNCNQRSAKIKRAKRLKKAFMELMALNYSIGEIAKLFGMSRPTMYSYMAIFFVMDTVKTMQWSSDKRTKFCCKLWDNIIVEINNKIKLMKMKFGESRIKWKLLDYSEVAEDYENTVSFNMPLQGNMELEMFVA